MLAERGRFELLAQTNTQIDCHATSHGARESDALLDSYLRRGAVRLNFWGSFWSPGMHAFRRDPRFSAFISRGGFMDYWKQYGPPDDCALKGDELVCR